MSGAQNLNKPQHPQMFTLGTPALDTALRGGLERASLHEVLADTVYFASAVNFSLALSARALRRGDQVIWVRQEAAIAETGSSYGPGLADLGYPAQALTLLKLRTAIQVLRAGVEVARCAAVGAVILETLDTGNKADLTATRRLKLAAEKSGVTLFLVRPASQSAPSAAQTRWLVRPAASPPLCESGLGRPRFDLTLLKHRGGCPEMRWHVEWNRDRTSFDKAVPQLMASVPVSRPLAA